jgi:putative transcriptional regulator
MAEKSKYLRGHFLLDSGQLTGSFFARTAVLLCQHDAEGAFGLVLNRTSEKSVGDVLVADLPDGLKEAPLYLGGPVQPSALSFLHSDGLISSTNVLPNLNLGHALDELIELGESFSGSRKIKIFAGYAGWAPGQLESELKRKAWLTIPASLEWVFDIPTENLWQVLVRRKGGWRNKLLAETPEDPMQN